MEIRHAVPQDMNSLLELFAGARRFMAEKGNPNQWWGGYPTRELLESDMAVQQLYVCEEAGHIYAAFVMAVGEDSTYQVIEGAWKNDLPYVTLHRIASTGEKRGMVDLIVRWTFEQHANVRGDTHELNLPMRHAFERNGFEYCGTIWVDDGTPRMAYHKVK